MRRISWIVVLAVLIAAWQAWVDLRSVPDYLLPSPSEIARALWNERSTLAHQAGITLREMLLGYALAVAAGLGAAIALRRLDWLRGAVYPLLAASQSIPVVAVAPLLVVYLGFGIAPQAVIVALVCFFPVTANALEGFRRSPAELGRTMRTLNASSRAIFWRVELPWAAPGIFTGARVAATYAAVAALFSEYAGGSGGLGDTMRTGQAQLDTPMVGAAIVILAALALSLWAAVTMLERLLIPWSKAD